MLRRYWTNPCQNCAIKRNCTTSKDGQRHETAEHPFGTIKARMGATHFLTENAAAGGHRNGHVLA